MAKKKVNKSEAIREYLTGHPEAGPKEVGTALKKKGITVQPALVSNVKAAIRRKSGMENGLRLNGRRRGRRGRVSSVNVDDLLLARDFAERLGGIAPAKTALEALSKLQ